MRTIRASFPSTSPPPFRNDAAYDRIMGLTDRGWVRQGHWADLVVFDDSIEDTATFTAPHQYPKGIPFVFVSGVAVIDERKLTNALPGKVLSPQ